MANCNLVGGWARPEVFYDLERRGLICWGGLTAGDWQYIGSQGVIQGTYEILARIAEAHFSGTLAGRFVLTAGLGGMGGAQPLAGTMAGAAILCVEVDEARHGQAHRQRLPPKESARFGRGAGRDPRRTGEA
jgi:urocanate hydratase